MRDGGTAFPFEFHKGMSLRDWFAGQALAGLGAAKLYADDPYLLAMAAYEVADDMLAERVRPKENDDA